MDQFVALLRGVNVGGGNRVEMATLRALGESLGWQKVRSYIASGNLLFEARSDPETLAGALQSAMARDMNVDVPVLVLAASIMRATLADCPFGEAAGNQAHVFFLFGEPRLDAELQAALIAPGEALVLQGRVIWLHAPDGVGRSKLVAKIGKVLGCDFTARNLNTLRKLTEMLNA